MSDVRELEGEKGSEGSVGVMILRKLLWWKRWSYLRYLGRGLIRTRTMIYRGERQKLFWADKRPHLLNVPPTGGAGPLELAVGAG